MNASKDPLPTPLSAGARLPGTAEPMHYWTCSARNSIAGDSWAPVEGPLVLLQHH